MAFQILNDPGRFGDIGKIFSTGLQELAQNKLNQLSQRQGLQALGYSPEKSQQLSYLSPAIFQEVARQKLSEPSQQAYASALSALLGGQEDLQRHEGQEFLPQEEIAGPTAFTPLTAKEALSKSLIPSSQVVPDVRQPRKEPLPDTLQKRGLTQQQATELAKLGLQQKQISEKAKAEAFKETKSERKEILDKAKSARQNLNDLERLEELEQEGALNTPGYVEFLKRSGLDIPALMHPGSEEFNKIATNFLRDAKTYFGARVSNYEIEQFLKTIPSLSQSPEGRKRVISNLKNLARTSLEYNNALKEVMSENKGVPPLDLLEQVDDKIEKKLDGLAKRFKEDLKKPVPASQNKFVTALYSVLGSVAGIPGSLLGAASRVVGGGGGSPIEPVI